MRFSLSFFGACFSTLILIAFCIAFPQNNAIAWDVFGYYLYLPALFLHGDLLLNDISWIHEIIQHYNNTETLYQAHIGPQGNWVMKYSMGLAVIYAPFFFIGHCITLLTDYPADGFSLPYQYALSYGYLLYIIIGIFLLRKVLLKFFNDKVTTIVLLIIIFGTNYFHVAIFSTAMPHGWLFTIFALILWLTMRWHETFRMKYAILLGVVMGLAILSRPTEIVCLLIPFLWGVKNKAGIKEKITLFKQYRKHVLAAGLAVFLIGLPQLIYWKLATGSFFYVSYQNPQEGLDLFTPHTLNVLFSFRKGWLVYTPIMIFALIGFYFLRKQYQTVLPSILVYFLFNLWLVSSWTTWWYAQSFSHRALVESYAVLALPLGSFIHHVLNRKVLQKTLFFVFAAMLMGLNFLQTWQMKEGILHGSSMTMAYYLAVFGKTSVTEEDKRLLLIHQPFSGEDKLENEEDYQKKLIGYFDYEEGKNSNYTKRFVHSGDYSFRMDKNQVYSPGLKMEFEDITDSYYAWIRTTVYVYPMHILKENPASLVIHFSHKGKAYKYKAIDFELKELKLNQWHKISVDYLTPEVRRTSDTLKVYVWLRGDKEIYIDDLEVVAFIPKE